MNKNLLTDYRSIALLVAAAHVAGILLTSAMVEKFEPPVLSLTMVELADGGAVGDGGEAGGGGGGAKEAEPAAQQPAESKPVKQEAAPVKAKPAAPLPIVSAPGLIAGGTPHRRKRCERSVS